MYFIDSHYVPNDNLLYVHWFDHGHGQTRNLFVDGEIIEAPLTLLISQQFLDNAKPEYCARDGNLVMIKGKTTMICYELIEQSPHQLSWNARLIKKEGL